MKHWWTNHGLSYCMQKFEEHNRVSSAILLFQWMNVCHYLIVCFDQPDADENPKGDGDSEDVDITGDGVWVEASVSGGPLLGRPGMTPRRR
jgi:hypothetical protein